ncbi:MAG: DUF1598 domain-containing protein [Pirellulaceae bacterium]|nr:DUF1598 domain-containing protein [Pirellulaceae bacterium]
MHSYFYRGFRVAELSPALVVIFCWFLGCLFALMDAPTLQASEESFMELLAAGEFGPAIKWAERTDDAWQRNQLLAKIAKAQVLVGARRAATITAGYISADASRSRSFDLIHSTPVRAERRAGGAAAADFDSLIDLITSTIAPESWDEVGGPGAIQGFPGGVFVNARGLLKKLPPQIIGRRLVDLEAVAVAQGVGGAIQNESALRKVSLTRLEQAVQKLAAKGKPPTEAMRVLAGMYEVKYIFVYPGSRDLVLAGPAGAWHRDPFNRVVNMGNQFPVLQLDDFVVLLRNAYTTGGRLGCSITPRRKALARLNAFLEASSAQPLKPQDRSEWLEECRSRLGRQDIEIFGIDARTRVAQVLVEADYHMKLIGMGLEPSVLGVTSYLGAVKQHGSVPESMSVLRWWFALNYSGLWTTPDKNAFAWRGPGAKVLSENEIVTARGERKQTEMVDALTVEFATSFTKHFLELSQKYPVYSDLRNIFDLALATGIMRSHDLPTQVDWQMSHFRDPNKYHVTCGVPPREVDSVISHMFLNDQEMVVGVSGGVLIDTGQFLTEALFRESNAEVNLFSERDQAVADEPEHSRWWWD